MQRAERCDIVVNFDIGRVPDIVPAADEFQKPLNDRPVAVALVFVRMPPQVKQLRRAVPIHRRQKLLRQRHQFRIGVVARRRHPQPVRRDREPLRRHRGARIRDPRHAQNLDHIVAVRPERIRHPARRAVGHALNLRTVAEHFLHRVRRRQSFQKRMRPRVQRNFHIVAVQVNALLPRHPAPLAGFVRLRRVRKHPGVDVERAFHAVCAHQRGQMRIGGHAVVVAERQRPRLSARKPHREICNRFAHFEIVPFVCSNAIGHALLTGISQLCGKILASTR